MSTIVRCRRHAQLGDVSYLRHFPIRKDGTIFISRIWVQDVSRATRFKHRENAELEAEYFSDIRPGDDGAYVYDLVDGGAA